MFRAFLVVWLSSHQMTVTLESLPLSRGACKEKLAEMVSTVKASGLEFELKFAKCERKRR